MYRYCQLRTIFGKSLRIYFQQFCRLFGVYKQNFVNKPCSGMIIVKLKHIRYINQKIRMFVKCSYF